LTKKKATIIGLLLKHVAKEFHWWGSWHPRRLLPFSTISLINISITVLIIAVRW
jgi:hypothetical protein